MSILTALDLFTVGIGPSSSHTVGPMRAARRFTSELVSAGLLDVTARIHVDLFGSLGATGVGHGTTNAIVAGLEGAEPEYCDPIKVATAWDDAIENGTIIIESKTIDFVDTDVELRPMTRLPQHSNAMTYGAIANDGSVLFQRTYFSVGGGFVESDDEFGIKPTETSAVLPYPFNNAAELILLCDETGKSIAEIAYENCVAIHGASEVSRRLKEIWSVMSSCVEAGLEHEGVLPGYLKVQRRAAGLSRHLRELSESEDPAGLGNEWLQAFAIAVNEENAAGMRVVTAPTNGAAGIIPAVGYFAHKFKGVDVEKIRRDYLLTAGAIGTLYKRNASISGAEAGCQGEVGSACSMAAGGLAAALGATPRQIENAAEIAMEHNLGLTCDPVGGLVQMPCIERNAIAAGTAVAATRLALAGDGSHKISLDTVIETMRQTGLDMSTKYKETSAGGLAVNVIEC
jgi:L-serine dehydratase